MQKDKRLGKKLLCRTGVFIAIGALIISAVLMPLASLGAEAHTYSPTTSTSLAITTPTYNYRVSSNVVKDSSGVTVYTGSSFTNALNWATSKTSKITYIPAGTYTLTGYAYLGSGSTVRGDGPDSTILKSTNGAGIFIRSVSNAKIIGIGFTGQAGIKLTTFAGATVSNILFQDITFRNSLGRSACFYTWAESGSVVNGLTYIRCKVLGSSSIGFLFQGAKPASIAPIYKNVLLQDCIASRCGSSAAHYNDWVVGYDFNENAKIQYLTVLRCKAEYCWEAGFHFETGYQPSGTILIKDCVSNYNGQKPSTHPNYAGSSRVYPDGPWYSAGYFLGRGVWNLKADMTGCTAIGNIPGHFGSWNSITQVKYGLS